jgi:uncharacterized protein involved in propanediol utilization
MRIICNKTLNIGYQIGYGSANGTFGELLQGFLPNKKSFMVTLPINLFSHAIFIPEINTTTITVFPNHKTKSRCLAQSLIKLYNIEVGGRLIIESELLEGKGLASSSADLVATAYAVSNAFKFNINEELIAKLIRPIEPSDGVMYQGIVSFYYKELQLIESIGNLSSLVIIGIDEGGMVDTIEYNSKQNFYSQTDAIKYENMLFSISKAIRNNDLGTVGKISTESTIMNQQYNPKQCLQRLIGICEEINGVGVSIAHSGTFAGILLDQNSINFPFQKLSCLEKMKKLSHNISTFYSLGFSTKNSTCYLPKYIEKFNNADSENL